MLFILKYVILFFFVIISEQPILTDLSITLFATEGSTINLTFINEHDENWLIDLFAVTRNKDKRNSKLVNASRYDIEVYPHVSEFQMINVTASDKVYYWYMFT